MLLVLDTILSRRLDRPLPKIIRDILQGLVYFVLALAILRQLGVEPGQLLTTSALLTAVVGLSLQDTAGNLIAGLSVQLQRPFDVGDWIQFDDNPKNIGRVIEINWRATTLLTLDENEIIVPNGLLAKAPLRNYTKPTNVARRWRWACPMSTCRPPTSVPRAGSRRSSWRRSPTPRASSRNRRPRS